MKTEKPMTLKLLLNEYREFLIATLEGKNPTAEEALRISLNTDDGKNQDGETERWENLNFPDITSRCCYLYPFGICRLM